jgi:uncharacterized protein YecE (DUF72 family)
MERARRTRSAPSDSARPDPLATPGPGGEHDPGPDAARERLSGIEEAAVEPIDVAGGGSIRVGTASWTDPTMTAPGVFYPTGAYSAEDRLTYYASRFPLVEVDATYYALPSRRTSELWVERTPPDFTFDIKAHALMTGRDGNARLPKDLRSAGRVGENRLYARTCPASARSSACSGGLEPLRGQLGSSCSVPAWFSPSEAGAILEAAMLTGGRGELRASWFNDKNLDRTMRFLTDNALPFVMVDEPQGFKSSVPPVVAVTSPDLAVLRFHGRNADNWEAKGITPAERFRYLYDRSELADWAPRLRAAAKETRDVHVLMNNCYANYGATNARELARILADLRPAD